MHFACLLGALFILGYFTAPYKSSYYYYIIISRDMRSFDFRFDSKVMGRFANFRIGFACPLLVVVKPLKPLTALSGIQLVYTDSRAL